MSADQAEHGQVTEREARQVAEAAREADWEQPSFGKQLFLGDFQLDLIHPHPTGTDADVQPPRRGVLRPAARVLRDARSTARRSSATPGSPTR